MNRLRNAAAAALFFLLAAPLAFAHAHPTLSNPAPNSTGPAPKVISVTFSEAIEPRFSTLKLVDAAGHSADPNPSHPKPGDAKTLLLDVPSLAPGTYTVQWSNVSTDGHKLSGEYKFTVKAGDGPTPMVAR